MTTEAISQRDCVQHSNSCYVEMLQREGYQKCLFCDDEIIVTDDDDDELCMDCKSKNKMY